jgi:hypothetical protein
LHRSPLIVYNSPHPTWYQAGSYQTNSNRPKSPKWASAKPANYDGDDWGDEDLAPPPKLYVLQKVEAERPSNTSLRPTPENTPTKERPRNADISFAPAATKQTPLQVWRSSLVNHRPISAGKLLPFIRPADIYKRLQMEQGSQRQPLKSIRPNMDSINSAKSGKRPDYPTNSQSPASFEDSSNLSRSLLPTPTLQPTNERKSKPEITYNHQVVSGSDQLDVKESYQRSITPKLPDLTPISRFRMDWLLQSKPEAPLPQASLEESSDPSKRLIPTLDPIIERKSEYSFDGYNTNAQKEREPIHKPQLHRTPNFRGPEPRIRVSMAQIWRCQDLGCISNGYPPWTRRQFFGEHLKLVHPNQVQTKEDYENLIQW